MGMDGIHPGILRDLAEELPKPFSVIYQRPWWLEVSKCDTYKQAGLEGGATGLSQCQGMLWIR